MLHEINIFMFWPYSSTFHTEDQTKEYIVSAVLWYLVLSTVCPKIVGKRYIFVYISYTNGNFDVLLLFWHSLQSYLFNNITKLLFYCHITCILALQRSILSSNCKVHIWTYGRHIWIYSFDFFHIYQRLDINRDISEH